MIGMPTPTVSPSAGVTESTASVCCGRRVRNLPAIWAATPSRPVATAFTTYSVPGLSVQEECHLPCEASKEPGTRSRPAYASTLVSRPPSAVTVRPCSVGAEAVSAVGDIVIRGAGGTTRAQAASKSRIMIVAA